MEIGPEAPTAVDGDIHFWDVIGRHVLRSTDAIILLENVKGVHRDVPPGTPLARMTFITPQTLTAWCDVRPLAKWPVFRAHDCFVDTKGVGRLDQLWEGDTTVHFLGFSSSGVGAPTHPPPEPAPYRPARPEERPTAVLAYRYCDGDGITSPPRFQLMVGLTGNDGDWTLQGPCHYGNWPDPNDKSKVDVDGLKLQVTPGANGALHIHVLNRIPPGELAPLEPGEPVHALADAPAFAAKVAAQREALKNTPVYAPTGEPPVISAGDVAVGQQIMTLPIKHALTGVLINQIRRGSSSSVRLEPGQAMFGVPANGGAFDGVAWCAPLMQNDRHHTVCLWPAATGYFWSEDARPSLAPTIIGPGGFSTNSDPLIERKPVPMPPMRLIVRLVDLEPRSETDPTLVCTLEIAKDWGEGLKDARRIKVDLPAAGVTVPVMGTMLRLTPSSNPKQIHVEAAVATGGDASH
jgi:hypothetical protein